MKMFCLIFLFFGVFLTSAQKERHYLHYTITASSSSPEFSAVGVCDFRLVSYYRDDEREWVYTEKDQTRAPPESRNWFVDQMKILSNCTDSPNSESHVLQRRIGCELERFPNGSESPTAFDEYGFDGDDFIAFDSDTMTWIEKNPRAKETKKIWDLATKRNQFIKHYLKNCMSWISTFNNTRKSAPHVYVFMPKVSDDQRKLRLTCLATGFYPKDIEMNIRSDGAELPDQTSSGVRPNADGAFQMRIGVEIQTSRKGVYDCHVTHHGLTVTRTFLTVFDKTYFDWASLCSVIGVFTLLTAVVIVYFIRRFIPLTTPPAHRSPTT